MIRTLVPDLTVIPSLLSFLPASILAASFRVSKNRKLAKTIVIFLSATRPVSVSNGPQVYFEYVKRFFCKHLR